MFRFYLSLVCSKGTYLVMKILKKKASYFPGYVAVKICPDYLKLIKKPSKVICISGTDGKTTTANLVADMLTINNYNVITNRAGSNTNIGVATALTNCVNIFGQTKVDAVVLEVDEHWTKLVFPQIKPNYLIVTNIIRDSLKRNAHPEYVFNKINSCGVTGMKVILNADELCSSQLLPSNERIFYGIDKLKTDAKEPFNLINDFNLCPKCDTKLVFDYVRYCHIGKAHCPNCDFKSKEANCRITKIDYDKKEIFVAYNNKNYTFPLINDGLFNIYNEIAIIALFLDMGFKENELYKTLQQVKMPETRFTEQTIEDIKIVKLMAKGNNSIPVSLVFDYIRKKEGNKVIVLSLDDYDEEKASEYVGWIYDTDYEFLNGDSIKQFIVSGPRCFDHKVRLLTAGIEEKLIVCEEDELKALEHLKKKDINYIYILHDMSSYKQSVEAENKVIEVLRRNK